MGSRPPFWQSVGMTPPGESAGRAGVWRQVQAGPHGPRYVLERTLTPADLQTLLLDVSRRLAVAVSPARLVRRWRDDRYVQPGG